MRGSFCLDGEPTGDETPLYLDDAAPVRTERPCRLCGARTTLSSRVCIDCELDGRPAAPVTALRPAPLRLAA